jgi:hypothetical protein
MGWDAVRAALALWMPPLFHRGPTRACPRACPRAPASTRTPTSTHTCIHPQEDTLIAYLRRRRLYNSGEAAGGVGGGMMWLDAGRVHAVARHLTAHALLTPPPPAPAELEDVLQRAPFETFPLVRGQAVGSWWGGDTRRSAGKLKGIVHLRLLGDVAGGGAAGAPAAAAAPSDRLITITPRTFVVRLYVLTGHDIKPQAR